jgi:nicotinamide riboside transporter PnuC
MSWIAFLFSIVGVILNAKKIIWCWPMWIIANLFWFIISIQKRDYPQIFMWTIFEIGNVCGWIQWVKDKKKKLI